MAWQPLSQRLGGAQPDGPYEGIPAHLLGGVEYWFQGLCGYRTPGMRSDVWQDARMKETAARIRSDVGYRYSQDDLMNVLLSVGRGDDDVFLDLIDATLSVWGKDANEWTALQRVLESAASVWRVGDDRESLTRIVSDEAQATFNAATSTADEATKELEEAWANAFGRNGDPSDAWDHAIKAVEDVLVSIVLPNLPKATLGAVRGHLDSQGNLWEMILPGRNQNHDVAPLVGMLDVIWPNHDRHGGGQVPKRTPSMEEAPAVVTLAATIVQWHRVAWVVQRR
jgi:hypothetical protein